MSVMDKEGLDGWLLSSRVRSVRSAITPNADYPTHIV